MLFVSLMLLPSTAQPITIDSPPTLPRSAATTPSLITVHGKADLSVPPDQYVFNVKLSDEATDAESAMARNNQQLEALQRLLRQFEVPTSTFQVADVNLSHPYRDGRQLSSFEARREISFVLAQTAQKNPLLLEFAKKQIGEVTSVIPSLKDPVTIREKARILALQQAQKKAQAMAAALGQGIGKAYYIEESVPNFFQSPSSNIMVRSAEEPELSGKGQIHVSATVRVSFLLH